MSTQVLIENAAANRLREARPYLLAIAVVAAARLLFILHRPYPWFPIDDAYITLHAAQALHWGTDPNYLGVSPVYGATSVPYLALLYLLLFLAKPLSAVDIACWAGISLYVLGVVRMVRAFGRGKIENTLLIALCLIASFVPIQLLNGMETPFAMAAVAWSLAYSTEDKKMAAAACAGVAASLRPELSLFALMIFFVLAAKQTAKERFLLLCAVAAPIIPWALWHLYATGSFGPETAVAKTYFWAEGRLPLRLKARIEGIAILHFSLRCGPIIVAPLLVWRSATGRAVIAFISFLFLFAFVSSPGSIGWNFFRYLAPLIPMLVWCLGNWRSRRFLWVCFSWCLLFLPLTIATYFRSCRSTHTDLVSAAEWCQQNLPPDATIVVHDAGYIAYATRFRIVDMVGLKTPEAVAINREITWPSMGKERVKAVAELAIDKHATHLLVLHNWMDMDSLPTHLRALGWRVEPLRTQTSYLVFRLTPPLASSR